MAIRSGDYYQLLKLHRTALTGEVETALWRYQSAIGNGPDSDVGTLIHHEASRVLLDGAERERYDEHLRQVGAGAARLEDWPTPWTYGVDISTPHTVPVVPEKRCKRCAGTPARRATIPRLSMPMLPKILDNIDKNISYVVQNCRSCGLAAVRLRLKTETIKVVGLLVVALALGFLVSPVLGLFVAFFPTLLTLGIVSAWLRFRSLRPPTGQLPNFRD
jgi:hypothetical protein